MKKRLSLCLSVLLMLGMLSGCENLSGPQTTPGTDLEKPFIGFRAERPEEIKLEAYDRVEQEVFSAYRSSFAEYSGTVYFDTLCPNDQIVYRIFQYAMDHAQPCILIDSHLIAALECPLEDILYFFALDSAVVEQNLDWQQANVTITRRTIHTFRDPDVQTYRMVQVYISDFSQAIQNKKKQAIQVAEQILSEMPQGLTDVEKVEYFYRYLEENVRYFTQEDRDETADHLYDALCVGETNCDGYANAFSLLCNMSDIPCLEKIYDPADDSEGHTWNAVCLDGVWYNVDTTGSDQAEQDQFALTRFCFSDDLLEYDNSYANRIPACQTELIPPDCTVTDTSRAGKLIKDAYKTLKNTDRDYVIALFPNGEADSKVLQKVANALEKNIRVHHYVVKSGAAIYYILPED